MTSNLFTDSQKRKGKAAGRNRFPSQFRFYLPNDDDDDDNDNDNDRNDNNKSI